MPPKKSVRPPAAPTPPKAKPKPKPVAVEPEEVEELDELEELAPEDDEDHPEYKPRTQRRRQADRELEEAREAAVAALTGGESEFVRRDRAELAERRSGWSVTPKAIGAVAATLGMVALLLGPVREAVKLSSSIDNLATAVARLEPLLASQGLRLSAVEARLSDLDATKLERGVRLERVENRVDALTNKK